jgi:hypothetical protein
LESLTHCEAVVACLVEMLLRAEESDPKLLDAIKGSGRTAKQQLVATLVAIAVFCEVSMSDLSSHF